jgi:hypothetical protein
MKKSAIILALVTLFLLTGCENTQSTDSALAISTPSLGSSSISSPQPSSQPVSSSKSAPTPTSQVSSSSMELAEPMPATENRVVPENVDERYLTGLGDISGGILEVYPGGFTFEGGVPQVSANESYAILVTDFEVEVVYTNETIFLYVEYERATDESMRYMGTVEDVVKGRGVTVWGEYEGDTFVADAVRVIVFV